MGNLNSSSLKSQHEKPDKDLSAPILDKKQLQKDNNNDVSNKVRNKRTSKNEKSKLGNKKRQIEKQKVKLDDMISNPQHMLPEEFSSLEELKKIYLDRREKKKEEKKDEPLSKEWDIATFGGGRVTSFVVTDDSKYLISVTDKSFLSLFDLETKILTYYIDYNGCGISIYKSEDGQGVDVLFSDRVDTFLISDGRFDCCSQHDLDPSSSILVSKKYFITGDQEGSIKIEYVSSSEVVNLGKVHQGPVSSLTLTNDKAYLISTSLDRSIKIFDVNGWKEIHHFAGVHEDIICSVIVSHDDQYIITGSKDRSVKVFDLKNKQEIIHFKEISEEGVMSVAISRDNKHIYCTAGLSIKILSLETKQEVSELKNLHSDSVIEIALSKDGKYLISAALDSSIMILNNETQEKCYLKDIHRKPIISLVISVDNKYIISGSSEGIKVFDFKKRNTTPLYAVDCGGETVHSLVISSRNKYLLSGCTKSMRLFELATMKQILEISVPEAKNYPIDISNDEEYIAIRSSRSSVKIIQLEDLKPKELDFESELVSIRFAPNSYHLIVGFSDNSVKIIKDYFYLSAPPISTLFKSTVQGDLLIPNDGKHILISDYKRGSISIFDVLTNQLVSELNLEGQISSLTLSGDSKHIIVAIDRRIEVFDLTGTFLDCYYHRYWQNVIALAGSEDNQYLVTSSENGILEVLRFGNKKQQVCELVADPKERQSVQYTAIWEDPGWIVFVYNDFSIKIFDLHTKLGVDCVKIQERDKIKACALQKGGPNIVFVFEDGKLQILNLVMKQEEDWVKISAKQNIDAVAISNDGQFLALAIHKESIIVLDFNTKQEKCKIALKDSIRSLGISNKSKYCFFFKGKGIEIYNLCSGKMAYSQDNCSKGNFLGASFIILEKAIISNDEKYLITGNNNGSVDIFDIETQNNIFLLKKEVHFGENKAPCSIEISDDDKYIFVVLPRTIKILDRLTKMELQSFRNIDHFSEYRSEMERKVVISQSKKYTLVGTCLVSPFYSEPDEIFYLSSKIPIHQVFGRRYDRFAAYLWSGDITEEIKRLLQITQDIIVLPYHWSALHLLAIMNPSKISLLPEYSQFKVATLVDSYGKTPLHYLLAQKNRDYAIINIVLNYIIDYLQDTQRMTAHEHEQICCSLSSCFLFIVSKVSPSVLQKLLVLCYPETYPLSKQVLPSFGLPDQDYTFSKIPYLKQEVLTKLYREGDDRIIFRTNMVYFDYDPRSDDMLTAAHALYENKQPIIFKFPFIENLIDHLWETTCTTMYLTALAFSTLIILLSLYIGFGQTSFILEINILFLTILFFISELIQMVTLGKEYLQSVWNWIDFVQLLLTFIFICSKIADAEVRGEAWIVSTIIMTGYLRWLSYLRLFSPTRILIEIILAVMYDMIGFIAVIASILVGFSLIFLEFGRNDPYPQEYSFHFYNTFKLLFGNYDDTDFSLSQTILVAFLMCVLNVVLLNLLISIIGNTFSKIQEGRDVIDAKTRLEMIEEAIILMRAIKPKKTVNRGYLIYKLPATIEEGNLENREWEGRINKIEKALKENKDEEQKNIKNSETQVVTQMKNLETKVDDMRNEINTIKDEIKGEVKHIEEQMQGLKDLVNLVLAHLNQVPKKNE